MVYNLLTELDKARIDSYRRNFVEASTPKDFCSIEHLLKPWDAAKSKYLEKLFGDQLIITRPVEFKESISEITQRIYDCVWKDERIKEFRFNIIDVYEERSRYSDWSSKEHTNTCFVRNLFEPATLATNKIVDYYFEDSSVFELPLKNEGEVLKIQKGMKPMRIVSKIANSFGIGLTPDENGVSDFEYFRRKHSLGLNQKVLKGDLCLSIHPLDYMTMSDNCEGWESCMSWMNYGEYKQGTVEMMNSPCVVVGYLASQDNKLEWNYNEEYTWNSKKWRCLFIVDREFIINVREYPYSNDNLTKAAIAELAKLSGWGEVKPEIYQYFADYDNYRRVKKPCDVAGRKVAVSFATGAMYNDFNSHHYIAVNPYDTEDIIDSHYYFSGEAECMACGCTDEHLIGYDYDTGALACAECDPHYYCESCEERMYGDDYYVTEEGCRICPYCWAEYTIRDAITDETYLECNAFDLVLSNKEEAYEEVAIDPEYITIAYNVMATEIWHKYFKIPEPHYVGPYTNQRYVSIDECTEEGLALFGVYPSNEEESEENENN
jgi:hypothetical protein